MTLSQKMDCVTGHIFNVFEWIVRVLLTFITLLIATQVFTRGLFNYSIPWAEEVALIGFIYITFFTLAIALRYDMHLRVELFVSRFPKAGRRAVELFDNLVLLAISLMMFYTGIRLTMYGVASIMAATRWPTSVIYIPTPVAGFMCCVHQLLRLTGVSRSKVAENFIEGEFKE